MNMFCMKNVEYVFVMFVFVSYTYTGAVSELFKLSRVQKLMPVCHTQSQWKNVCGVEMT